MIEVIPDLPDGTIGFRISGTVESKDYTFILDPAIEEELARHEKINALVITDPNGVNYTAGAMWQDTKVGLRHPMSWNRVALVSDNDLAEKLMPVLSAIMPGEFKTFAHGDEGSARTWLNPAG